MFSSVYAMLRDCSPNAILLNASRVGRWLLTLVLSPSSGAHIPSLHMHISVCGCGRRLAFSPI